MKMHLPRGKPLITTPHSGGGLIAREQRRFPPPPGQIGTFKAEGNNSYSGKITDPEIDKTCPGKATLSGTSPRMSSAYSAA